MIWQYCNFPLVNSLIEECFELNYLSPYKRTNEKNVFLQSKNNVQHSALAKVNYRTCVKINIQLTIGAFAFNKSITEIPNASEAFPTERSPVRIFCMAAASNGSGTFGNAISGRRGRLAKSPLFSALPNFFRRACSREAAPPRGKS